MSTDKKLLDLMHRDLDGDLTPAEKTELDFGLDNDKAAKQLYINLKAADAALASVPEADPPAGMKAAIMNQVRPWPKPRPSWIARVRQNLLAFREQFRLRPVVPFAVGVAAGLAVFAVYIGTTEQLTMTDESQYAATLVVPDPADKPEYLEQFNLPQATGTITVTHSQGIAWLGFQTAAQSETRIELSYDPDQLSVRHLDQLNTSEAAMSQKRGSVTIIQAGQSTVEVGFISSGQEAATVKISVTAGSGQYQDAIALGTGSATAGNSNSVSD